MYCLAKDTIKTADLICFLFREMLKPSWSLGQHLGLDKIDKRVSLMGLIHIKGQNNTLSCVPLDLHGKKLTEF